jgi:hypothetical protein
MNVLSIHTERAQLEIHTEPAKVTISNTMPTFVIKQTKPEMRVVRKMPQFNIEWEEVTGTDSQLDALELSRQFGGSSASATRNNRTDSTEALKTTLSGNALSEIVEKSNALSKPQEISRRRAVEKRANIKWDENVFEVQWTKPGIEVEWDVGEGPVIEVEPYYVEINLKQKPSVSIRVNTEALRNGVGDRVDERV